MIPATMRLRRVVGVALMSALLLAIIAALAGCTAAPQTTTPSATTTAPGVTTTAPAPVVPTYTATIAECRTAIREALEETGADSMSVALVDGETVVWSEAFGLAQKSTGQAATTDTLYCIGSVSKLLATISVMMLADQGKIELDEPVVTYLPEFSMLSPEYRDITVRMLVNHSSGFAGSDYRNGSMAVPYTDYAEQVLTALKEERLKHDPGYLNVYCNDGFTMVEILVEALTGRSYPDFVHEEILAPLGMDDSRYAQKPEDLPAGAYAEAYVEGQLVTPEFMSAYGSGGLYSTPSDMGRLAMMLMNGGSLGEVRILSPGSVAEMATDQTAGTFNPLPSDGLRYGLGWDTVTQPGMAAVGITAWGKAGKTFAYSAEFLVLPEEQLAAVVLTDSEGGPRALAVAEHILLRALTERGSLDAMPEPPEETTLPEVTPSQGEERALSGLYAGNSLVCRATVAPDGSLSIETWTGEGWSPGLTNLTLRTDGWYTSDENPMFSWRHVAGDGRSYLAVRATTGYGHYLMAILYGEKLFATRAMTAAWEERAGQRYLHANVSSDDWTSAVREFDPSFTLTTLPELPGYLFTPDVDILDASTDDARARMFLLIPGSTGRDLNDIAVVAVDGEEWLRQGSTLYRPLAGVPALALGPSTVTIGSEGLNEWRALPATGTLSVSGGEEWRLYDDGFEQIASGRGSGRITLAGTGEAMYLMLFGSPGETVTLNLSR